MKTILLAGVTAVSLGLAAGTAHAALSLSGGTGGTIPGLPSTNNALIPLGFTTPLGGYYGAQVSADPGVLTFEYLGREAQGTNIFNYTGAGGGSISNQVSPDNSFSLVPYASFSRSVAGGTVAFNFSTNVAGAIGTACGAGCVQVTNGSNPNASNPLASQNLLNFFAHVGNPPGGTGAGNGGTSGNVVYLFLDDTGPGAACGIPGVGNPCSTDDDNHDDMVIRITWSATPIPEPATLGLLGAGLVGLGVAARRRRKV